MSNINQLLADILAGRATFATFANLAMLMDDTPDLVMEEFNDIVSDDERKKILHTCVQHPSLSQPLLERWLLRVDKFDTPKLQRYLCELIVQMLDQEMERWHQEAQRTNHRLAEAAVKLSHFEEIKASYARLQSRFVNAAEIDEMLKEIESKERRLRQAQTLSTSQLERKLSDLRAQCQKIELEESRIQQDIAEAQRKLNDWRINGKSKMLQQLDAIRLVADVLDNPPSQLRSSTVDSPYRDLIQQMNEVRRQLGRDGLQRQIDQIYEQWQTIQDQTLGIDYRIRH